jgi:hypothetical protein
MNINIRYLILILNEDKLRRHKLLTCDLNPNKTQCNSFPAAAAPPPLIPVDIQKRSTAVVATE